MGRVTDDAARVRALRAYDILDTPPDELFDQLTQLASESLDMPISLVSLIDEKRQWFKSRVGLDVFETDRQVAFCDHAIRDRVPLVVNDAQEDERFAENPLVTGDPKIRFYAGIPIHSPDGYGLGTLCVIDHAPRELTAGQLDLLGGLARLTGIALEMHRKSAALDRTLDEMTDRQRHNELLASMLVHDMRSPLAAIIGLATIEIAEAERDADKALQDIVLAAERINRMAMDALDLCLSNARSLVLRLAQIDLIPLIGEQVRILMPIADNHKVEVDWKPNGPVVVEADPDLISRVIGNLLDNAIRHLPAASRVTVELNETDGLATVCVQDNGPGIPEEQLEWLFEPLSRGASASRRGSHYGLGLAFCRLAISRHGGTIRAESPPEGGARFVFTLPVDAQPTTN